MINVNYTLKNVKIEQEQKELLLEKIERKFGKYKEDLKFDVKIQQENSRYIIRALGSFKNQTIEAKDEEYNIIKAADKVINKISSQIQKIESKITSH